jgi:hypothetical protein
LGDLLAVFENGLIVVDLWLVARLLNEDVIIDAFLVALFVSYDASFEDVVLPCAFDCLYALFAVLESQ